MWWHLTSSFYNLVKRKKENNQLPDIWNSLQNKIFTQAAIDF